jgi:DNA-binding NarL/FixJ family response regulator
MTRVLIVDDQEIIRQGLRSLLAVDPQLTVVGECTDGAEVMDRVSEVNPDVVIMDVRMPIMDGATATGQLRAADGPPVLILTTFDDDETLAAALRAGAAGFVIKSAPGEDILRAIETVASGDCWIDPRVASRVLAAYRDQPFRTRTDMSSLTDREMDVLRAVGRGLNNQEVALELFLGEATVKTHLGRILTKLNLRDRSAAIVLAHENGLVENA